MNLTNLLPEDVDAGFSATLVQKIVAMLVALLNKLGIGVAMPL